MATTPTYTLASVPVSPSYNIAPYPANFIFNDVNVLFNDTMVYFNGGNVQ